MLPKSTMKYNLLWTRENFGRTRLITTVKQYIFQNSRELLPVAKSNKTTLQARDFAVAITLFNRRQAVNKYTNCTSSLIFVHSPFHNTFLQSSLRISLLRRSKTLHILGYQIHRCVDYFNMDTPSCLFIKRTKRGVMCSIKSQASCQKVRFPTMYQMFFLYLFIYMFVSTFLQNVLICFRLHSF